MTSEASMTDEEIAAEIQSRGLEVEYLRELAAALGFAEEEGWSEEVFTAMEAATHEQRRAAAERTILMA
jgi:DNA-binding protein H-NS